MKCFTVEGDPLQIGWALGALAKPVFDAYMAQSVAWERVRAWRGHPFVAALHAAAVRYFPEYVAELNGMADVLGWPAQDLFLWNCRGELVHRIPDGCTTLAAQFPGGGCIAHNEDGDPYLKDKCMLVDVRATGKPGFVSFYYPGSLPGHTFAVNRAGLAQAINNLRIVQTAPGVPRMILARAVLDAHSLDEAVALLRDTPRAGGFHHTIGDAGPVLGGPRGRCAGRYDTCVGACEPLDSSRPRTRAASHNRFVARSAGAAGIALAGARQSFG